MSAVVRLMEAVGSSPDLLAVSGPARLVNGDVHSIKPGHLLVRNSDGSPAFSTERWLTVSFTPTFGKITAVRFWFSPATLNDDWIVTWGARATYQKPSASPSDIAVNSLPLVDAGEDASNLLYPGSALYGPATRNSLWLVLQATWTGTHGPATMPTIGLHTAWREC